MQVVLTLTFEILNLVMAITFLTLFIIRMVRIRRLSQTTRYLRTKLALPQISIPYTEASSLQCSCCVASLRLSCCSC